MALIGILTVDLVANTATFSGDLGKASGNLKVLADDAEAAGQKMDFSMQEARGSVVLWVMSLASTCPVKSAA